MAKYSSKVLEHFFNPRNVGEVGTPSGEGLSGNPSERNYMRFTIRVEADHLYVGGKPFRSLREKWADIAAIDIDSRYGTIRTRAGRTRRLDLSDLEGANHVRAALEEARRRLAPDEAKTAEG